MCFSLTLKQKPMPFAPKICQQWRELSLSQSLRTLLPHLYASRAQIRHFYWKSRWNFLQIWIKREKLAGMHPAVAFFGFQSRCWPFDRENRPKDLPEMWLVAQNQSKPTWNAAGKSKKCKKLKKEQKNRKNGNGRDWKGIKCLDFIQKGSGKQKCLKTEPRTADKPSKLSCQAKNASNFIKTSWKATK